MVAALGLEMLLVAIVDQRVEVGHRLDDDIAAAPAIAAIRPAELDEFLAPKADAAGPAVAALEIDLGLVEKLHGRPPTKKGNGPAVPLSIGPRMPGRRSGTFVSAGRRRLDRDIGAAERAAMEADAALDGREQG